MLPPADFRLAKIVAEIITSKQKVLPVLPRSIAWRSDFENQSVGTHRRRNPMFEDQRKLTTCRPVQKCTEESFSQCMEMYRKTISKVIWVGKGELDAILSQINKKLEDRFHFQ